MRFDVVVDVVGGASLEQSIEAVAAGGTILLLGALNPQPDHARPVIGSLAPIVMSVAVFASEVEIKYGDGDRRCF